MSNIEEFQQFIDARGLECPLPLLKTRLGLKNLAEDDILLVIATDAGSWLDIPRYIAKSTFLLLSATENNGEYRFLIQRKVES